MTTLKSDPKQVNHKQADQKETLNPQLSWTYSEILQHCTHVGWAVGQPKLTKKCLSRAKKVEKHMTFKVPDMSAG